LAQPDACIDASVPAVNVPRCLWKSSLFRSLYTWGDLFDTLKNRVVTSELI
jgi:hypothetical protein